MRLSHLAVCFWRAGFLLAGELALEARASRRGWDTLFLGGPEEPSEQGEYGPTAAFPFRSPVVSPDEAAGALRVWTASSSYGADEQLEPEQVFPNLIASSLGAEGEVVTLNASVDGHTIAHNLVDLLEHGPTWKPDYVVLYQMSNDINIISRGLGAEGAVVPPGAGGGWSATVQRLAEETTVYKNLKSQVTARLTGSRVLDDGLSDADCEEFERILVEFIDAVEALGARPILCTFATGYVEAGIEHLPAEYELNLLRFNVHLSAEGWVGAVARLNQVVERVALERGIPLVDACGALAGREELFRDLWHLRPEGHRILADLIAAELRVDG